MNRKGFVFFYTLMLGLVIIILGVALIPSTLQTMNLFMDDMTCDYPSSNFVEAACWMIDFQKPLLIGGIILVGIGVLLSKQFILP